MLRSEIPIISAACPHVIRFAIARKITSCTFIARSQATSEYFGILPPTSRMPQLQAPFSGQITCYLNRTDDMLTTLVLHGLALRGKPLHDGRCRRSKERAPNHAGGATRKKWASGTSCHVEHRSPDNHPSEGGLCYGNSQTGRTALRLDTS